MPTSQQNLAFVREKVIAAAPEIMEPSVGAIVEHRDSRALGRIIFSHGSTQLVRVHPLDEYATEDWNLNQCKIIGRPIRLSDVLRAIQKKLGDHAIEKQVYAYCSMLGKPESWNLSQDDLSLQSEEVWAFLAEVLK